MIVRIAETGEEKELELRDCKTGVECTVDFLSKEDALHYNAETEEYEMNLEEYAFCSSCITTINEISGGRLKKKL